MSNNSQGVKRHFTLRRGFSIFMGLLVLALYVIWAAYGAAPTSLSFIGEAGEEAEAMEMAGGGHGASSGGMTPDRFEELTRAFIDEFSLPDGSVKPVRVAGGGHGEMDMDAMHDETATEQVAEAHGMQPGERSMAMPAEGEAMRPMHSETAMGEASEAHGMGSAEPTMAMADHGSTDAPGPSGSSEQAAVSSRDEGEEGHGHDAGGEPIDIYLMAYQFAYEPQVLRLEHGVPYRFRMMSMDVNHGASIHTGFAGYIIRRPARAMVDTIMTFEKAGEYMVYCTVYCGEGHDMMKGKIIVE